jgi:hypothetical protein
MKGGFDPEQLEHIMMLVGTIIIAAILVWWATGKLGIADFLSAIGWGGGGTDACQKPSRPADFETVSAKAYISSEKTPAGKQLSVHKTAAISDNVQAGFLRDGDTVYVQFNKDNPWNGCYKVEDWKDTLGKREVGIFVGTTFSELQKADGEMTSRYSDVWIVQRE